MSRWLIVGAFLMSSLPVAAWAEDIKLGYVDLPRALGETEDGRKAKANLKKVFDQKQKEIDEQQEDLKKSIEDLDKKRTLLPADKVREKETELQQRMQKVQQTYMRHQQDLSAKEQEATAKIFERMSKIITKIATDDWCVRDSGVGRWSSPARPATRCTATRRRRDDRLATRAWSPAPPDCRTACAPRRSTR